MTFMIGGAFERFFVHFYRKKNNGDMIQVDESVETNN